MPRCTAGHADPTRSRTAVNKKVIEEMLTLINQYTTPKFFMSKKQAEITMKEFTWKYTIKSGTPNTKVKVPKQRKELSKFFAKSFVEDTHAQAEMEKLQNRPSSPVGKNEENSDSLTAPTKHSMSNFPQNNKGKKWKQWESWNALEI